MLQHESLDFFFFLEAANSLRIILPLSASLGSTCTSARLLRFVANMDLPRVTNMSLTFCPEAALHSIRSMLWSIAKPRYSSLLTALYSAGRSNLFAQRRIVQFIGAFCLEGERR